jgi:SAM-dependent methyltransferase
VRYPQVKQAVHRLGQRSRVHPERLPCLDDARWFITRTELADVSEYDRSLWEERWSQALREHGGRVAQRPPNAHLTAEVNDLRPGRALDAGCGHGSDTLWLAAGGWQVTAVDFAATALAYARSTAEAMGAGRRRAHRVGRGRSCRLDASPGRIRPCGLPVRPRGRFGRGDGAADGDRGRPRRDSVPR